VNKKGKDVPWKDHDYREDFTCGIVTLHCSYYDNTDVCMNKFLKWKWWDQSFLFLVNGLLATDENCGRREALKGLAIVNFCYHYYDAPGWPPAEDHDASKKPYADLLRKLKPAANLIMANRDTVNPNSSVNSLVAGMTMVVNKNQDSQIEIFETYHPNALQNGKLFDEMLKEVRRFQDYLQSITGRPTAL
jgi:hypothetical protein